MDQREHQLQSLSICHRLYNFIMKTIVSQALKTVPLGSLQRNHGHPIAQGRPCEPALSGAEEVPTVQGSGDDTISSPQIIKDNNDSCLDSGRRPEEEAPISTTAAQLPKAPKKTVSINEVVEEIGTPKKSKKNSKATRKSNSFDREEDDQKPLKSILKLPSKPTEKSDSFVNRSSD
jgi:hypothetical protein